MSRLLSLVSALVFVLSVSFSAEGCASDEAPDTSASGLPDATATVDADVPGADASDACACDPATTLGCGGDASACTCKAGYLPSSPTACVDVNECLTNRGGCHEKAQCFNLPGGHRCECDIGSIGDGVSCGDYNECLVNNGGCGVAGKCTNIVGGATCSCKAGYVDSASGCVDVDECATNNGGCHADATCVNTEGGRTCTCKATFTGDGITCAPGKCGQAGACTPGATRLGATCGNCSKLVETCDPGCVFAPPACTAQPGCEPPATVDSLLRRSCYCIDCGASDITVADGAKCAYLRWAFFPWGVPLTKSFFDKEVKAKSAQARALGMVTEFGIPEYLSSPTPALDCPADGLYRVSVDAAVLPSWNTILTAHRPSPSIQPFPTGTSELAFSYAAAWVPGFKPNWVYGKCAGIPSLGTDEGWRYHLFATLAAIDAGVGGLYVSQVAIRQPTGFVALVAAARAYYAQKHPGKALVVGAESIDGLEAQLASKIDYVKEVADIDVVRSTSPWPTVLDSDGSEHACYAPNLLEPIPATTGPDPTVLSCQSVGFRSGGLCIADSERTQMRPFASPSPGAFAGTNPNARTHHDALPIPIMLELDGFQQCAYKTARYASAGITDGVLPIFYKPNACADYDQTTCLATVRNGLPNTMAFLAQPKAVRAAFQRYAAQAAKLMTVERGVPHYFPALLRVDQNLTVVAQSTSALTGATPAEVAQSSLVRYCPSDVGVATPIDSDAPYLYNATSCGDVAAVQGALASVADAERAAAEGFVRHLYATVFARAADAGGLASWTNALLGAANREQAALDTLGTFLTTNGESIGGVSEDEFTRRLYRSALGREATAPEVAAQSGVPRATRIANVRARFECRRHLARLGLRSAPLHQGEVVAGLYHYLLARAVPLVGDDELVYWADQLFSKAQTFGAIVGTFAASPEFGAAWTNICASDPANCSAWYVHSAYFAILHRGADPGGLAYWAGELDAGRTTRAGLLTALLATTEFTDRAARLGL